MAGKDSKIPYVTESSWDVLAISGQALTLARSRFGGAEGNRTPDLRIANATLSQLSYGPAPVPPGENASRRARNMRRAAHFCQDAKQRAACFQPGSGPTFIVY